MSVKVERLENNMARLTIEVSPEKFEEALNKAYLKMRGRITLPGFRKGKAPRKMIERAYGAGVFYEDAANIVIPEAYDEALRECEETVVSRPEIDVTQIEAGKPFIFTAEVALKPEVELGQYKGVEVPVFSTEVTEAEIDAEVDKERDKNARIITVEDRPVEQGDMIKLDFAGTVDGEAFDGGTSTDYPLTIGSGSFIPGFEEQLVGAKIGEETEVKVTFPEDYHAEELKGREAVFVCTVKQIQVKELPEADDEFAQEVSDYDTMEAYRGELRRNLENRKAEEAKRAKENAAVAKIIEGAKMDIPEAMVQEQVRRMIEDFRRRIESQGITMEQYMQFTGMDEASLGEQMRPDALRRIQNSLVLEAVAKAENIEISDERVDEEIAKMAEQYKMEPDKLKEMMGEFELDQIRNDLTIQAAVDLVRDAAVETESAEEKKEEEE